MILEQIIAEKKKEVEQAKRAASQDTLTKKAFSLRSRLRGFQEAISSPGKINLIAELKKASPSCGVFRADFQPIKIAQDLRASGAAALSILTDQKFFQGDIAYLQTVKAAVNLPILRKDFIIDEYQLYQSVCAGADAVLLIARILSAPQLKEFLDICAQLNLDALCEVHNQDELDQVLNADCAIIGINNRDLNSFSEDLQVTARLIKRIPKGKIVVSESAVKTSKDVKYLQGLGVHAVLIGEALMRSEDILGTAKEIMGY